MNRTFIGIGAGPIQTGIFVAGAFQGGFDRIVLAEVDSAVVSAVRESGSITVNTAGSEEVTSRTYTGIEILNPNEAADRARLVEIAKDTLVFNTALPSTRFYPSCASWMREAFLANPAAPRYLYSSENSTTAAAELKSAVNLPELPATYYLDTVIGKMSKVFTTAESDLPPLAPGLPKGHLVEEFSTIYTSSAPNVEDVGIVNLYPKADLVPFEEAKLYGHNASHLLLALLAMQRDCTYMSDAARFPEIVEFTQRTLINECGAALCRKYAGVDEYFTPEGWERWAVGLIRRMTSPLLADAVARVARDLPRKLGWDDRLVGALRLCNSQNVPAPGLTAGVGIALRFAAIDSLLDSDWKGRPGAAELAHALRMHQ